MILLQQSILRKILKRTAAIHCYRGSRAGSVSEESVLKRRNIN